MMLLKQLSNSCKQIGYCRKIFILWKKVRYAIDI